MLNPQRGRQGSYEQLESTDVIVSRLAQQDKVPWYNKPNLRFLYLCMVPSCLCVEATSGFDASMIAGLQAVPSWLEYFDHPHTILLGLMTSAYSLGALAAIPLVSSVVDNTGRRYPILFGGIISMMGGLIQGSSLNYTIFVVARFILGFSNVFCIVAAASLIAELSHPNERAIIGCLFNSTCDLGAVAAAAVVFSTFTIPNNWAWRIPSLLQTAPSLLQVTFIWFIPESPRWLISKGRGSEAYAVLVKYHAEGDESSEFVKAEYSQIAETLEAEMKVVEMNRDVLLTPGMRKRVIIATSLGLFVQLCGVGLMTYYLVPILESIGIHDNRTKNIVNLAKQSWSFVNGFAAALIAPRYPRRRIFLICTISLFVVFTAWTVASAEYSLTQSKIAAQVILALIFLYGPAYNVGLTALVYPYLVELFPFHVRSRGIAIYQWSSRIGAFVNQFAFPIGIEAAGWRWYIVYCVWNAFQVVFVYLMFPETSGRTLEELTFLYEEDREALSRAEAEALCRHGGTRAYGTMEAGSRRTNHDE